MTNELQVIYEAFKAKLIEELEQSNDTSDIEATIEDLSALLEV